MSGIRWPRMIAGFCSSVIAIGVFGYLCMAAVIAVSSGASGDADWSMLKEGGLRIFWASLLMVALFSFPVWLVGGSYAEKHQINRAGWYIKAGAAGAAAATAFVSLFIFNQIFMTMSGGMLGFLGIALLGVGSGAFGGWVYWLVVGRHAGEWRRPMAEPVIQNVSTAP